MSTFTAQPSTTNLIAAYGTDLSYTYDMNVTGNSFAPALTVEIWIDSSKYLEYDLNVYDSRTQNGSDYDYTYIFDVSDFVQWWFDCPAFMNTTTTAAVVTNGVAPVQVKVFEWIPDGNGKLTKQGTSVDSNTCTVLNSRETDLSDHKAISNRKFLTNEPTTSIWSDGSNKYLSYFQDGTTVNSIQITTYNSSGTQLNQGVIAPTGTNKIVAMNFSGINLMTYQDTSATISSSTSYFTVQVGFWNDISFVNKSETRTYYIKRKLCEPVTIHFQNKFGCQDSCTVEQYEQQQTIESETYEHRTAGSRRVQSELSVQYKIEQNGLMTSMFTWLQEIQESVLHHIEVNGTVKECVIQDNTVQSVTYNKDNDLSFVFTESSKAGTHIN